MLSQIRDARDPSGEIRDRPRICTSMHCIRLQSNRLEPTKESRDALRPPQTHPWFGQAPITWPIRRPRRVHPRRNRPKPSETRKTQAVGARHRLTSWSTYRRPSKINAITHFERLKPTSFSTQSAQSDRCCGSHRCPVCGVASKQVSKSRYKMDIGNRYKEGRDHPRNDLLSLPQSVKR